MEENPSKKKRFLYRNPLGNLLDSVVFWANCYDEITTVKH